MDEIDGISTNNRKPIKTIIDFIKTGHLDKKILEANKKEILDDIKNDKNLNNGGKVNFARYNKKNKRNKNNNNLNNQENDFTSDEDDISNIDEDDDENKLEKEKKNKT